MVHPVDRLLFVYRLGDGAYGRLEIRTTEGRTPVAALPDLSIDWDVAFPPAEADARTPGPA
jgi:hypothetical protein